MNRLFLITMLAGLPVMGAALQPTVAHALEQDGISMATYQSIMKCDVDIRAAIAGEPADVAGSLAAAIAAIESDMEGADRATRTKLASWLEVLRDGQASLQASSKEKEKRTLDELQSNLGSVKMVAEAQENLAPATTRGR